MTKQTIIRPLGVALLAATVLTASACDTVLYVNNPGDVTEEGLASEEAIPVLIRSAYGAIATAYEDVVLESALFTDELTHSGSFDDYGRIDIGAAVRNDWLTEYEQLSTARYLSDLAVERVRASEEAGDAELAEALAYAGWSRILLAEQMCQVTIAGGPAQSPDAIMQEAEGLLSESIQAAQAAGDDDILNLARVGRARVRLWLGDAAGVVADAEPVPEDYEFLMIYDVSSNGNDVWVFTVGRRETAIEGPFQNLEAIPQCAQLQLEGEPPNPYVDPDVVSQCTFGIEGYLGPDNETPLFVQLLYPDESSDIPLATGAMAKWYAMEAQGTADPFDQAVALYLTGNRLAQMRRIGDPYLSGRQSCWILPEREEDTNPNL